MSREQLVQDWKTEGLKDKAAVRGPRPRLRSCVEAWPEWEDGEYNPACCRFPKSCSCPVYHDAYVSPEDLEEISPRATAAAGAVNAKTPAQSEKDAELHRYLSAPEGPPQADALLPKMQRTSDLVFVPFSVRQRIQKATDAAPQGRQAEVAVRMVLDHIRPEIDRLERHELVAKKETAGLADKGGGRLTRRQSAILGLYTGIICGSFDAIHEYAQELSGCPIWTHEFADKELVAKLKAAAKDDFLSICYDGDS